VKATFKTRTSWQLSSVVDVKGQVRAKNVTKELGMQSFSVTVLLLVALTYSKSLKVETNTGSFKIKGNAKK